MRLSSLAGISSLICSWPMARDWGKNLPLFLQCRPQNYREHWNSPRPLNGLDGKLDLVSFAQRCAGIVIGRCQWHSTYSWQCQAHLYEIRARDRTIQFKERHLSSVCMVPRKSGEYVEQFMHAMVYLITGNLQNHSTDSFFIFSRGAAMYNTILGAANSNAC